jgi:hypothetical protein
MPSDGAPLGKLLSIGSFLKTTFEFEGAIYWFCCKTGFIKFITLAPSLTAFVVEPRLILFRNGGVDGEAGGRRHRGGEQRLVWRQKNVIEAWGQCYAAYFRRFLAQKSAFFLEKAAFCVKIANWLLIFFRKYFKIYNIGPRSGLY